MELKGIESNLCEKQNVDCGSVAVVTLEQLPQKYKVTKVDLLLIDVEGIELPVLRSFPWQSASAGRIFCELHTYGWKDFGYCGEDFRKYQRGHGYRCVDLYLKERNILKSDACIGPSTPVPTRYIYQ